MTGLLSAAVLAQFIVNLVYFSKIIVLSELSQLSTVVHFDLALNSTMAFTDTLLALVLMWLLWRSRSEIKRTAPVINRLIMYTVGTGLVTSLCAISGLLGAIISPNALVYLLANLILPKCEFFLFLAVNKSTDMPPSVYFNCLLASSVEIPVMLDQN